VNSALRFRAGLPCGNDLYQEVFSALAERGRVRSNPRAHTMEMVEGDYGEW
jgi:hypothetical protein